MSMSGSHYSGNLNPAVGQSLPGSDPDGKSRSVRDTPASNRRSAAITGLVLGLIPLLSIVGLIVSAVALRGYRKVGERGYLAITGLLASAIVLTMSVVVLLPVVID